MESPVAFRKLWSHAWIKHPWSRVWRLSTEVQSVVVCLLRKRLIFDLLTGGNGWLDGFYNLSSLENGFVRYNSVAINFSFFEAAINMKSHFQTSKGRLKRSWSRRKRSFTGNSVELRQSRGARPSDPGLARCPRCQLQFWGKPFLQSKFRAKKTWCQKLWVKIAPNRSNSVELRSAS